MPVLDSLVDSLESVPEKYRDAYREGTDDEGASGKFVLNAKKTGDWSLENTGVLRRSLQHAKDERTTLKETLSGFKGLNAADVRVKLAKLEEIQEKGAPDAKKQVEEAVAEARTELEKKYSDKLTDATAELAKKNTEVERLAKGAEIDGLITEFKGKGHLLRPLLEQQTKVEWEKDGKTSLRVVDPKTGKALISSEPGNTGDMTPRELMKQLSEDKQFAECFEREQQKGPGVGDKPAAKPGEESGGGSSDDSFEAMLKNPEAFVVAEANA